MSDFVIENGVLKKYTGPGGDVVVPDGVTSIGDWAFRNCTSLKSIILPDGVTSIGGSAFAWCESLTSITLPDGLTSIGVGAFEDCTSLKSITLPEGVTSIGACAFLGCTSLTSIILPDGVTSIGVGAFADCLCLTSITLPEGVTTIGDDAFNGCKNLTSITIPDSLTSIGRWAFAWCESLKNITLPEGVTSIGLGAFEGCTSLTSITLPEGVTTIGDDAFMNCNWLKSITIPGSVTSIGDGAFRGCKGLADRYGFVIFKGCLHSYHGPGGYVVVPDGVTSIGNHAFWGCSGLTGVTLSEGVTRIGDWAFQGCKSLKSIILPEGVTSIGNEAFQGCTSLKRIILPEGVTSIGNEAFRGCTGLADSDGFVVVKGCLYSYHGPGGDVVVPEGLTSIGRWAFAWCESLKNITLPEGVTSIGLGAFEGCTSLTSITLPEGVTTIGDDAFNGCKNLTSITIPDSLTSIGSGAFFGCKSLKSIILPDKYDSGLLTLIGQSKELSTGFKNMGEYIKQADEDQMADLIKASKHFVKAWNEKFQAAYLYSDTRAAMLLSDKRKELDKYARIRGLDEDELRDNMLSDLGLDKDRCRHLDLGNQTVTVRMLSDFTFSIELPDGKTAKSLPKKGADSEKYDKAKSELAKMKKDVKSIWKNRADLILGDFISGKGRAADKWERAYSGNPVLHGVACLIVWEQDKNYFTRTDGGLVRSDGTPYVLSDKPIRAAHPMEMETSETEAWQAYFTARGLKQPFAQIWEPVHTKDDIAPDRYAGCPINFFQLQGAVKHGLSEKLVIPGCTVDAKWTSEQAASGKTVTFCDIKSFKIYSYSRAVNHAVAYLDRVTVLGRIEKDDISAMDFVRGCNIAQITDFIAAAQEANAVNVLAALLEYKNAHFADFDPMDEFTLEW